MADRKARGRSDLADRRLLLGADAMMSVTEAASLLPGASGPWRTWIREKVRLRSTPTGGMCVRWGDVLAATEGEPSGAGAAGSPSPAPVLRLNVKPVDLRKGR